MTAVGAEHITEAPILQLRCSCLAAFDGWSFDKLEVLIKSFMPALALVFVTRSQFHRTLAELGHHYEMH